MFKTTSPERAKIIENLSRALEGIPMGGTLPYSALMKAAPGFMNAGDQWLLARARENVEKNQGCAFEVVRGIGIKRMTSEEIPDIGLNAIRSIRRKANQGKKRIQRVNPNSLSPTEQRRVIGMSAMLGAIAMMADGRKASAVATVADPNKPIPPKNILEMFRTE
jgi:hypothetical protein